MTTISSRVLHRFLLCSAEKDLREKVVGRFNFTYPEKVEQHLPTVVQACLKAEKLCASMGDPLEGVFLVRIGHKVSGGMFGSGQREICVNSNLSNPLREILVGLGGYAYGKAGVAHLTEIKDKFAWAIGQDATQYETALEKLQKKQQDLLEQKKKLKQKDFKGIPKAGQIVEYETSDMASRKICRVTAKVLGKKTNGLLVEVLKSEPSNYVASLKGFCKLSPQGNPILCEPMSHFASSGEVDPQRLAEIDTELLTVYREIQQQDGQIDSTPKHAWVPTATAKENPRMWFEELFAECALGNLRGAPKDWLQGLF